MNRPHHTQIFARRPHSYREMPQHYAETTMVHPATSSRVISAAPRASSLSRRTIATYFAATRQVKEEFRSACGISLDAKMFYISFGFKVRTRLSFHDPKEPEKIPGNQRDMAERRDRVPRNSKERNADYAEAPGEAAPTAPSSTSWRPTHRAGASGGDHSA